MRKKVTVDEFVFRPIKAIVFGDSGYSRGVWGRLIQGLNDNDIDNLNCVIVRDKPCDKNQRQFNRYALSFKKGAKEILRDINCVSGVIDAYNNFNAFSDLADNNHISTILFAPEEKTWINKNNTIKNEQTNPLGLLTMLLFRRFCQEKKGFSIISGINEDHNGEVLKAEIIEYSHVRGLGMDFINWLTMENQFINSFVETRVGNQKIDANLVVSAENYFLCVLDKEDGLISLNNEVMINPELSSYYVLRRHIFDGALCSTCAYALLHDVKTLDAFMLREKLVKHMTVSVFEEIIPALDVNFETTQAYTVELLQRFEDASLSVKWSDYAENLGDKFKKSIVPLIRRYAEIHEKLPKHLVFSLFCTMKLYDVMNINDDFSRKLKECKNIYTDLWGEDISYLKEELDYFEKKMG